MIRVVAGHRADPIRAEKLSLIKHPGEDARETVRRHDGEQPPSAVPQVTLSRWVHAPHEFRHPPGPFLPLRDQPRDPLT